MAALTAFAWRLSTLMTNSEKATGQAGPERHRSRYFCTVYNSVVKSGTDPGRSRTQRGKQGAGQHMCAGMSNRFRAASSPRELELRCWYHSVVRHSRSASSYRSSSTVVGYIYHRSTGSSHLQHTQVNSLMIGLPGPMIGPGKSNVAGLQPTISPHMDTVKE